MLSRIFYILLFHITILSFSFGQSIYSLHTQWDDDIKQWDIVLNDGEKAGEIAMTWRLRNDATDWTYRIDALRGNIKQKWDNNANVWELRSGTKVVQISTVWSGDFSSFRVSDENSSIKVELKYLNADPIEWQMMGENGELFYWYNEYQNDIRDWIVEDHLPDNFSFELKLAAVFVTVLHSI